MFSNNKNLYKYGSLVITIILTSFLAAQGYFKPEHLIGMKYHWWLDMIFHGGYYFLTSLSLSFFFANHTKPIILWTIFLLVSSIFELAQIWVPGRTFALLDFISNTIGITLGLLLYFTLRSKEKGEV
jgi:VanZ family protein